MIHIAHHAPLHFLQGGGAELGQLFRWRDAWKPRLKCEQKDLDFERACVRFNIAAAQCYLGRCARERGTQARGLSQARDHFQQAAAYLDNVHATVKAAIWGLRPRWAASSLTPELSLDVLAALRELMLAQAQRVVYEKAISEGLSDSSTAKLASGASAMYAGALKALEKPEVREHLNEEGGLFSKGDKSWLGRAESQQHAMAALAEEHSSREHAANFAYGEQVARLQRAVAAAAAAERVAAATLHASSPERKAVAESHARLQAVAQHAAHENANIYLESVPPPASLAAIEAKRLVQPTPAPPPAAPRVAAFEGLLPATLGARIAQHHTQVHDRLLALSTDASRAAAEAEAELRRLSLPEVLDACSADKRLPQRLVDKVEQVRAAGGLAALRALRGKCDALEADAAAAAGTADALLASEDESDAALMREYHDFDPEKLATGGNASSGLLGACRARLAQCRTRLRTAADVTKGLVNRLTTGLPSLEAIEAPLEELQASLPHLDGTPLEAEPCVPALRKLLDDLDGLKADGAASLAAAHQAEQRQRGEAVQLGEGLLVHHLAGTLEEAMAELLASSGLEQLERDAKERSARRAELLRRLAEQARVFETARSDAHSYEARQAYLAKLRCATARPPAHPPACCSCLPRPRASSPACSPLPAHAQPGRGGGARAAERLEGGRRLLRIGLARAHRRRRAGLAHLRPARARAGGLQACRRRARRRAAAAAAAIGHHRRPRAGGRGDRLHGAVLPRGGAVVPDGNALRPAVPPRPSAAAAAACRRATAAAAAAERPPQDRVLQLPQGLRGAGGLQDRRVPVLRHA